MIIRKLFARVCDRFGLIDARYRILSNNHFVILMYHRVIPESKARLKVQAGMYVDPLTFEMHLKYLKEKFDILPLHEIPTLIHKTNNSNCGRMRAFLTIDDGWRDNYEFAFPLLNKYEIPATIFLPTGYIGTKKMFWTDQLALLLGGLENITDDQKMSRISNRIAQEIINIRGNYSEHYENIVGRLNNTTQDEIISCISEISSHFHIDLQNSERHYLTMEELHEMGKSGLIFYGSHTVNHKTLTSLNRQDVKRELEQSKDWLLNNKLVEHEFIPFSYPNGDFNSNIEKMVKSAGYHLALTTKRKLNNINAGIFDLGRVNIHQDMTSSKSMFAARIAGIY